MEPTKPAKNVYQARINETWPMFLAIWRKLAENRPERIPTISDVIWFAMWYTAQAIELETEHETR